MKSTFILVLMGIALTGYGQPKIQVAGEMSNIMRKGNLAAHIDLDTMQKTNLYALGPVEGLKGEIIVLDGQVSVSSNWALGFKIMLRH